MSDAHSAGSSEEQAGTKSGQDPIGLEDVTASAATTEVKFKAFGVGATHRERQWKRQTRSTGSGAVRVRSFHGKLSGQGMEYLDNAINEWLDQHPEVEVKFVTSTVEPLKERFANRR